MTNALDKTNAAAQAPGRLVRVARQGVALCVLACAGIGAAQAQYHGRRDDAQLPPPPSARGERLAAPVPQIEQPREQQRGYDQQRDQQRAYEQQRAYDQQRAYEDQRRQAVQAQGEGGRRGRLTPDERRDLRRQINEAGMDIYPNAQRR
jgi:hypothetical protein